MCIYFFGGPCIYVQLTTVSHGDTIGVQQTEQTTDDAHEVVVPWYNLLSNRAVDTQKENYETSQFSV